MFRITEYVPANEIWETAIPHEDKGQIPGLVRGYCIEVLLEEGVTDWMSCSWIDNDPEQYFNQEWYQSYLSDLRFFKGKKFEPTGRISFRGYGREYYDPDDRETYIEMVNFN